jgi:hypothetical protein
LQCSSSKSMVELALNEYGQALTFLWSFSWFKIERAVSVKTAVVLPTPVRMAYCRTDTSGG